MMAHFGELRNSVFEEWDADRVLARVAGAVRSGISQAEQVNRSWGDALLFEHRLQIPFRFCVWKCFWFCFDRDFKGTKFWSKKLRDRT